MPELPLVSIIIPHQAGSQVLLDCLASLERDDSYSLTEVLLIDNGSVDGSVQAATERFPSLRVLRFDENQGFAAGCNRGIEASNGEYVLLLNDDTELEPGLIGALVARAEEDPSVGALQPKTRSLRDRSRFEYSGAAGGLMDIYAYPFSRGRLMDHVEEDLGQYDDAIEIFWASGVCMLIRRAALDAAGLFDEVFFAYMEEIDLCWRIQLQGYRVIYVPEAVIYHIGGYTLDQKVLKRMYLNHRNSLITLIKNYSGRSLLRNLPVKIILELLIAVGALVRNPRRSLAVLMAFGWLFGHLLSVARLRASVQSRRRVTDREIYQRLYLGMAPIWYFVFGIRQVTDLPDIDRVLHRPYRAGAPPTGASVRPERRDFFFAYLDQAPTGLAIQRAVECEAFARFAFDRPVLDVGCGDGTFSRMLMNGVILDAAIDTDPMEVELARETRCYADVRVAKVEALPFDDASMQTVLANAVLAGVPEIDGALSEIHRVLAPEGKLYFSVPTPECTRFQLWNRWLRSLRLERVARAYERMTLRVFRAEHLDAPEVWEERLEGAGFEVDERIPLLGERAARWQDLFLPIAAASALSKGLLGRKLAFPRLHRLVVRSYRAFLRSAVAAPADPGTGVLFAVRKSSFDAQRPETDPRASSIQSMSTSTTPGGAA